MTTNRADVGEWLPTLCCVGDENHESLVTKKPWLLTIDGVEWTAASNRHVALFVRGAHAGATSDKPSASFLMMLDDVRSSSQPRGTVTLEALRAWAKCPPLRTKREKCPACAGAGTQLCEECGGRGNYECECRCGECSHHVECSYCKKTGRVACGCEKGERVTKLNEIVGGRIGNVHVNRRLVDLAVGRIKGRGRVTVRTGGPLDGVIFEGADWKAIVMPLRADGLEDETVAKSAPLSVAS